MRKIILISLVFFSAFVKAQVTVDPETFPQVSGAISDKYLYTNTGGEGKIKIKTILDSVQTLDTISVTYADFYTAITNSQLQVGRTYILIDFQTIYDQMDFDNTGALKGTLTTKTGAVEQIWVLALSPNQIADKAYSATYPKDEIQYDWTYNATLINGSPAKGRISERIDEWNNRTDYDHREIKFIRYDNGSGVYNVINDNGNASADFLTFGSGYGTALVYDNYIGDFTKYALLVGQEYSNNVFHTTSNTLSNYLSNVVFNNTIGDGCRSVNMQTGSFGNTLGNNCISIECGKGFVINTLGDDCANLFFVSDNEGNIFGNSNVNITMLNSNKFNTFGSNNIYVEFGTNNVNNTIGNDNSNIKLGISNASNIIGNDNQNITMTSGNGGNTIGNSNARIKFDFFNNNNSILDLCTDISFFTTNLNNTIASNSLLMVQFISSINGKTIDATTYPFMFGSGGQKTVSIASNGDTYARYFDGTNDINVLIP